MALVLACSVPTGLPEVVQLRFSLGNFVSLRVKPPCSSDRTTCVHVNDFVGARDASTVYIGGGVTDCQLRPAVFFNPFFYLVDDAAVANSLFSQWLYDRADLPAFLSHIRGRQLRCDCLRGMNCHFTVLRACLSSVPVVPPRFPPLYFTLIISDHSLHICLIFSDYSVSTLLNSYCSAHALLFWVHSLLLDRIVFYWLILLCLGLIFSAIYFIPLYLPIYIQITYH